MAEKNRKTDIIIGKLLEDSNLTPKQLEALLLYSSSIEQRIVKNGYVDIDGKKVSKGAFFRILSQAKKNVRKSIVTLILMSYTGLMDVDQFSAIMQIANIMMQSKGQDEDLIRTLLEKLKVIVDIRKRAK
ncbi:MAG: hypothetical protein HA496_11025 [Thaumarchaeota archaeon]|jgi:hypothetical protein|nr:hypothetical protein [Nitrososphaerota archaeon]